jgi:hypothetical protein
MLNYQPFGSLSKTVILLALVGVGASVSTAGTTAKFANGWSVKNNADWTPFPPSANPLGAPDVNCTGGSILNSWAKFTFPGFGIPGGDVVTGIQVKLKYRAVAPNTIQLTDSGSLVGGTRMLPSFFGGDSNCASTAWTTVTGANDLWGTTLTTADFNAGNVGFRITQNSPTVSIDSVEIVVTHSPGGNQPPNAVAQNVTVSANANCQALVTPAQVDDGSSDPDGDPLTLSLTPAGPYPLGDTMVTLTADDGNGGMDTDTATITVEDITPPLITLNGQNPQTFECPGVYVELGATVSDNCLVSGGVTIDAGGVNPTAPGSYQVTYNATDDAGNAAVQVIRTVNVVDTTPPTITLLGANPLIHECATAFSDPGATANDACAGDLTGAIVVSGAFNPNVTGSYTLNYNVSDPSGNAAATVPRTVVVVDTTPPTIDPAASNLTVECDGEGNVSDLTGWLAAHGGASASDTCGAVTWSHNFGGLSDDCGATGSSTVTFTATDEHDNSASTTATFTIVDTTAPVISFSRDATTVSGTITILPNEVPITIDIDATDICGDVVTTIEVTCHKVNKNGKIVDKSESCEVVISGDQVIIEDSGGVGDIITIFVESEDECGNVEADQLIIEVVNPGQGGGNGNEGVGNGVDANTKGHDNNGGNDDPETGPGNPGAKGGKK